MFLVRSSKFRHVFGNPYKKEQCYEGIKITRNAHDSNFCAVNPKFIAIVIECAGGGVFLVLPLNQTGRVNATAPKVCGHRGPVTDIKWNPFNDNIIASCSDDTTVKIWQIPDEGLLSNLTEWQVDLHGHTKKVGYIEWHPTAENILLSAATDFKCILWNTERAECIQIIAVHPDTIFSVSWNRDGSLFATTCKDKQIRIINPRLGQVIAQAEGHSGSKSSKVLFVDKERVFTTGFSRMSERQYSLRHIDNLSKPLRSENIDSSSGVLIPYYDYDTKVVFLAGKGDGNIRYFEIVDEAPYIHYLSQFQSGSPQRGLGVMPKRGLETKKCEIVRFYKLHTLKDICEPISMIVPRKSEIFQDDIFPPTASTVASLSAEDWMDGINRDPILVSLKDGPQTNSPQVTTYRAVKPDVAQTNAINRRPQPSTGPAQNDTSRLPASLRNIHRLSTADDYFTIHETENDKLHVFETKRTIAHTEQTSCATVTNDTVRADKKIMSTGYTSFTGETESKTVPKHEVERHQVRLLVKQSQSCDLDRVHNNGVPGTDAELRKAYFGQVEEIQSLKEQLSLKEKRIRQLEEEVRLLRTISDDSLSTQIFEGERTAT